MAKASIHFEKGSEGFFNHNDRTTPTVNSIFSDEKNEVSNTSQEAFRIYRNELQKRAGAYTRRTGQKLQKKVITHRSAIINLHQHHTLEDLKPLILKLEKDLDTKVLQVAIHRDEGHISDDGKSIKNYHAHIEIMGIDSQGISIAQNSFDKNNQKIRKRLDGNYYRELQTFIAKTLKMERGKYNSKAKRLDTYVYKHHKERESKTLSLEKAKVKDLTQEIKQLRAELKEIGATREEYAKLEQMNRDLKEQIEAKDLTIDDMRSHICELEKELFEEEMEIESKDEEIEKLKELAYSDEIIESLYSDEFGLPVNVYEKKSYKVLYDELKTEVSRLQSLYTVKDKEIELTYLNSTKKDTDISLKSEVKPKKKKKPMIMR
jgi:hypothetical protein